MCIDKMSRIFSQSDAFEQSFERAIDYIIESMEEYEFENIDDIWRLVIRLWYMEDGYVRYDHDPQVKGPIFIRCITLTLIIRRERLINWGLGNHCL